MQKNHDIDIEKKDDYQRDVEALKRKYKKLKEQLEWADDTFEEETIEEEMDHFATQIRALNQKLAAIAELEKKA
jgi:predicted  nucleic acid-binding Zn-ribbon protein